MNFVGVWLYTMTLCVHDFMVYDFILWYDENALYLNSAENYDYYFFKYIRVWPREIIHFGCCFMW